MLKDTDAFSSFSVNNLAQAKEFYSQTLGVDTSEDSMGLVLEVGGGSDVFVYEKEDHIPATYTVLNFIVDDIDEIVDKMSSNGIVFEHYDNITDEKGIARGFVNSSGPDIAWFKDPAGNILSVLCEE